MSIERCCVCSRQVDTDLQDDGDYDRGEYICRQCADAEMKDAEEWMNQMRQVAHEGTR